MDDVAVVEEPVRAFDAAVWRRFGLCRGESPGLFIGPADEPASLRRVREGECRRLCTACPVRLPCREFARRGREYGFWGGESEAERARVGCGPAHASARSTLVEQKAFARRRDVGVS